MKLQADPLTVQSIHGYGSGWIEVGGRRYTHSLIVGSRGELEPWNCTNFDTLEPAHFAPLASRRPELVLFGSGARLRFPRPQWLQALVEQGIGLEAMDTAAACRTYNILAAEGRHVIAALLLETP